MWKYDLFIFGQGGDLFANPNFFENADEYTVVAPFMSANRLIFDFASENNLSNFLEVAKKKGWAKKANFEVHNWSVTSPGERAADVKYKAVLEDGTKTWFGAGAWFIENTNGEKYICLTD